MWEKRKLTATRDGIRVALRGNASIADQKAWAMMPKSAKQRLSKRLRNADGDSRPNGYDCHMRDRRRQEAFLTSDQKIVGKLKSVKAGKLISHGGEGNVYAVENLPGFVVKTAIKKTDSHYNPDRASGFRNEANFYKKHDLIDEPLFIPTKEVRVGNEKGLLRPKVTVISEPNRIISRKITSKVTDEELEIMRQKLIADSKEGFVFYDGLQIGFDKSGRLLEYDAGTMYKTKSRDAFAVNNAEWLYFLTRIGKARTEEEAAKKIWADKEVVIMVWKQIILEGGFPQWVDVPETSTEEFGRTIREGYAKGPSAILRSRYTGWDKKRALWRR